MELRIGVVATLSGPRDKLGRGVKKSAEFSAESYQDKFPNSFFQPVIIAVDDFGTAQGALHAIEECISQGCHAIIGPADSGAMFEVLRRYDKVSIPIVSTIATATELSALNSKNFLRCTTPDIERCEILLNQLVRMYGKRTIRIYAATGTPESYSQAAKRDLEKASSKLGLNTKVEDYSTGRISVNFPDKKEPFVIAAVSSDGVTLLKHLRSYNRNGQAFSFGSSTSWLTTISAGTIVVCDLDRDDVNLRIRDDLDKFLEKNSSELDPSLTTKNAVFILASGANTYMADMGASDISAFRQRYLQVLKEEHHRGLFGNVKFSEHGEMLGYEQISLLRVVGKSNGMTFTQLDRKEKPLKYNDKRFRKFFWKAFVFTGTIASIIGLGVAFVLAK